MKQTCLHKLKRYSTYFVECQRATACSLEKVNFKVYTAVSEELYQLF